MMIEDYSGLDQQQLINGRQDQVGRHLCDGLPKLRAGRIHVGQLGAIPQLRNLALLEIGLRQDVAIDLHEHLLDDFAAAPTPLPCSE